MLRLRLHMEFAPESVNEAAGVLRSLTRPVRSEPGCSATRLVRNADERHTLTWVEEWRSEEAFERHLRTTAFRQILAVMELAAREPKVEIDEHTGRTTVAMAGDGVAIAIFGTCTPLAAGGSGD